ncbi:uncharacterized protein [Elaeis guineensis]|uniref:uncharacterized protein n=1 Tax=Elaeis guineensis var. tenera TaxID=51953 RepID=UPI003C6D9033
MELHAAKRSRLEEPIIFTEQDVEAYNAILGRPSLGALKVVVSSYHLMMKILMEAGVEQVRGNQAIAQQCFATKLQAKEQPAVPQPELPIGLDACHDLAREHARPSEDLVEVYLGKENLHQTMKIRSSINQVTKARLIALLQKNTDLFTWTVADMPGIDPKVMTYHLGVDPTFCLIKQKKRSFSPEHQKAIAKEVDNLVKTGFIREVMYLDWLANVVLVKKVMLFGLKNTRATYQLLVNKVFKDQIDCNMEVYVTDILIKS